MKKKKDIKYYCFLDKTRLCTMKCRAAYESDEEVYCNIVWSIQQIGYVMSHKENKMEPKKKIVKKRIKKKNN